MASLAEHLSGPIVEAAPRARSPIAADLAPIGLFWVGLTLFVVSCSVLAHCRIPQSRQ